MAKTAKKSAAKKSKTKSTSTKAAASKKIAAPAKTKAGKTVTLDKLYKFNLFAAGASLLFAVLSLIFVSKESFNLTLAHATKDELASSSQTVLGPAYHTLATIEVRYFLAFILGLSAIFSLLLATKLRSTYETGVKNSVSWLRWVFMGVSLGLTLELVSLVGGIGDAMSLKLIGSLVLVTTVLAFISERENKTTNKHYLVFLLSLFTGLIAWFPLGGSLVGTALYGIDSFAWYVYALSALVLAGFINIAWTQYGQIKNGASPNKYLQLEAKYIATDLFIKIGVFVIILLALYK